MPELKVGVQLASLGLPLQRGLRAAAQMGATAVEIDARQHLRPADLTQTALRQLKKQLDDLNLVVCAVGFRTRRGYDVLDRLQERIEATKSAMTMAYQLGAQIVVNQIGRVPEERSGDRWDLMVDVLTELGKHAHRCGAFLAAETGSEPGDDLAALLAAVPEGSLGITLNPGNLILNQFSAADAVKSLGNNIMYVHAKDGVQDLAQGRGVEVPLGRGSADFPQIIGMLEEFSYRGYFTVERHQATDAISEAAMAVQYLQNL